MLRMSPSMSRMRPSVIKGSPFLVDGLWLNGQSVGTRPGPRRINSTTLRAAVPPRRSGFSRPEWPIRGAVGAVPMTDERDGRGADAVPDDEAERVLRREGDAQRSAQDARRERGTLAASSARAGLYREAEELRESNRRLPKRAPHAPE